MSPSVRRARTARELSRRVERFGQYHPATFAAYARAFVAWQGRIRPPRIEPEALTLPGTEDGVKRLQWLVKELPKAYTVAQLRAFGNSGWDNRSMRRRKRL